jgi:hypothetical protein
MIQTAATITIMNEAATITAFDKILPEPLLPTKPIINSPAAINSAIKESGFIVSP